MAQRYQDTLTIACVDADFPAWRKGRARAFAWVVGPGLPGADVLIALGRRRLAGYLLERYERQPHVTVAFCGLLPGDCWISPVVAGATRQTHRYQKDGLS